jgi:hypothetical protein
MPAIVFSNARSNAWKQNLEADCLVRPFPAQRSALNLRTWALGFRVSLPHLHDRCLRVAMLRLTLFVLLLTARFITAATPPPELYSPLLSSKIRTTAQGESNPPKYPQYTDATSGKWQDFIPDTWTSGFFPATLYALNTRAKLCNTGDGDAWVALGRQWSTGEIPLETKNTLVHDVGFVSMPFVEEYYL